MWGPPEDVEGECNARLYIGDDYGDNRATMRCSLPTGHGGRHEEMFRSDRPEGSVVAYCATVKWLGCDREQDRAGDEEMAPIERLITQEELLNDECPRCGAPTQSTLLTPPDKGVAYGCTRCSWPVENDDDDDV